jgi:hypothetical protein
MSEIACAPVGRWAGTVTYGPKVEEFTVAFAEDGTLTESTSATTGRGNWVGTGENTFDFSIEETLNTGDSGVSGDTVVTGIDHLVITISAGLSGSSFDGTGVARVYDAAGTEIFAIAARMNAKQLVVS